MEGENGEGDESLLQEISGVFAEAAAMLLFVLFSYLLKLNSMSLLHNNPPTVLK